MSELPAEDTSVTLPRAGETWTWAWLTVTITKAGPKRVTYRTATDHISSPTDRFLSRFHRTNLTTATDGQP